MDGVADNPWPWFACGLAAFLFAAWWAQRTGSRRALAVAAAALALALVPVALSVFRDTPTKQVARALERLRTTAERRDARGLLEGVSARFQAGPYDRQRLEATVLREFGLYVPNFVRFPDAAIAVEGDQATVQLEVATGGEYRMGGNPTPVPLYRLRFELTFRREDATWMLRSAKRLAWTGAPPAEIPLDQKL